MLNDDAIVVVSARRTPIGKFLGGLAELSGPDLGVAAVRAAISDVGGTPPISHVFLGSARQAGAGPNPARQVAVRAGLGDATLAVTVNMACASGMEAIANGVRVLRTQEADWVVAGGMESMSRVPFLAERFRTGYRMGDAELVDAMYRDGFNCPLAGQVMGETAETLARQYTISRSEQDQFAKESQDRAAGALATDRFASELASVEAVPGARPRTPVALRADEHPRAGTTLRDLAKLPAVFARDGTVTAGNSSGITDGAAALVLTRAQDAARAGIEPLARLVDFAAAGVDPKVMGIGPVPAVRALLRRTGRTLDTIDLIELNEAFAAQVIAVDRELRLDRARLNVNGGAIALGHPIGASGARICVTLIQEMIRRGARRGLATLCVSGGMGHAMLFERE
jgi:acetyl-CoA C-acetyltransferase